MEDFEFATKLSQGVSRYWPFETIEIEYGNISSSMGQMLIHTSGSVKKKFTDVDEASEFLYDMFKKAPLKGLIHEVVSIRAKIVGNLSVTNWVKISPQMIHGIPDPKITVTTFLLPEIIKMLKLELQNSSSLPDEFYEKKVELAVHNMYPEKQNSDIPENVYVTLLQIVKDIIHKMLNSPLPSFNYYK